MFTCEKSLNCVLLMAHFCTLLSIFKKKTFYMEINIDSQVAKNGNYMLLLPSLSQSEHITQLY